MEDQGGMPSSSSNASRARTGPVARPETEAEPSAAAGSIKEWLGPWLRHSPGCGIYGFGAKGPAPCDCGLVDALDEAPSPEPSAAWRPVESAPRDGTAVDLLYPYPRGPYGLRATVVQAIAQSCLRGLADVVAPRIDQLRLLGNGVSDPCGALALRTLSIELSRRSAGAALLVERMTWPE